METLITAVVVAAIGSAGLFSFITFLIQRRDGKKDNLGAIQKQLIRLERDSCRTQLMLLMADFPDDKGEIMRIAEHYFADLKGNWYMTSMFHGWLEKNEIEEPLWFNKED